MVEKTRKKYVIAGIDVTDDIEEAIAQRYLAIDYTPPAEILYVAIGSHRRTDEEIARLKAEYRENREKYTGLKQIAATHIYFRTHDVEKFLDEYAEWAKNPIFIEPTNG